MKSYSYCSMNTSKLSALLLFFLLHELISPAVAQDPRNDQNTPYNTNFRPSMTVTIVVLAVACLIIAFFTFFIRRCAHDIHIDGGRSIRLNRTRPAPRGLDASIIETFPTFLYSVVKGLKIGKGVLECAVCLNEFEDEETLRLLPKCNHVFHPECIDGWLSSHTTCPLCRADLVPNPSEATAQVVTEPELDIQTVENEENRVNVPDISDSPRQVSIRVMDDEQIVQDPKPDVIDPTLATFPVQNRPVRAKSTRRGKGIAGRFPRSHSTGHSVVNPGENYDRFTLRLPEDVRKQILNGKLNRTTSCVALRQGSVSRWGSTRNGSVRRNDSSRRLEWAAKSERWLSRATSFFWRSNNSGRLSKKGDGSVSAKSDGTGVGQSSFTRPPV